MTTSRAPLPPIKTCPYGCRYANDGWHMENCPGPPAFLDEPERERERAADERERVYEALDRPHSYPAKGVTE